MKIQLGFRHFLPLDPTPFSHQLQNCYLGEGKSRKERQPKRTNSRISKTLILLSICAGSMGGLRLCTQPGRPIGKGRMFVWDEGTAGSNPCSAWLCLSQWIFNKSQLKLIQSGDLNIIFHIQQNFQNIPTSHWMSRNMLRSQKNVLKFLVFRQSLFRIRFAALYFIFPHFITGQTYSPLLQ